MVKIKVENKTKSVTRKSILTFTITVLFFTFCTSCFSNILTLEGIEQHIYIKKENLSYYEDSSGKASINSIMANDGKSINFQATDIDGFFLVKNPTSAYWFKITLKNKSHTIQHYLLESYNYKIDSVIFYESKNGQITNIDTMGVAYKFSKRALKHKNIVHAFWINSGEECTIYLKIKNRYETPLQFVLRKLEFFTSYALAEYFFLGLFYGSILIVIILNILAGFYLKSRSHFYYVFYAFFVGIFFLSKDGMGFQFLWPNFQFLNEFSLMLSVFFMTVFLLLYTGAFLNLKIYYPSILKIFYYYIAIRSIILFINLVYFPEISHFLYIDVVPFLLSYYCSYKSYRNNYPLSNYFLIGISILLIGIFINFLQIFSLIQTNVYTFYVVNFCFLLEMIVFYFALAERIRFYKQHKSISKGLKKEIEDKEQLIEQFIYKTSHDLSGPVKTILGVTNLALSNNTTIDQHVYMEMIRTTASRLDEILKSVAEINIIRAQEVEKTLLDISILMEKVLNNTKIKEYSDDINLSITNNQSTIFREDSYILYTLITNLLIYQLKCLRYSNEKKLTFAVTVNKDSYIIIASNNAIAIPEEYHKDLFNIFFRLSNNNEDLGTYMHIVKLCIEKLNGAIVVENSNSSTNFKITIPF